jgi:hypothetical protein
MEPLNRAYLLQSKGALSQRLHEINAQLLSTKSKQAARIEEKLQSMPSNRDFLPAEKEKRPHNKHKKVLRGPKRAPVYKARPHAPR